MRAGSLSICLALILLSSTFWPVGAMAQESEVEIEVTTEGMCSVDSTLGTVELSYDESTAIQGIVEQDVASSAEDYRRRQAAEELGIAADSESKRIADKYNLYFLSPDGTVNYAEKLNDRLDYQNGWLIGTTIDGRVEYGGKVAEDIALCPELTTSESGEGVCTQKAGEVQDDFNIEQYSMGLIQATASGELADPTWEEIKAAGATELEEFGEFYIDTINWATTHETETAWGTLSLGQSRLKADSWRTSLAVFPQDGTIFIIPRTFMYFTARMKALAVFDEATQFVFQAWALANLVKGAYKLDKYFKGRVKADEEIMDLFDDPITNQQKKINQATDLIKKGDFDEANTVLRKLEQSTDEVIKVIERSDDLAREVSPDLRGVVHNLDEVSTQAYFGWGKYSDDVVDAIRNTDGSATQLDSWLQGRVLDANARRQIVDELTSPDGTSVMRAFRNLDVEDAATLRRYNNDYMLHQFERYDQAYAQNEALQKATKNKGVISRLRRQLEVSSKEALGTQNPEGYRKVVANQIMNSEDGLFLEKKMYKALPVPSYADELAAAQGDWKKVSKLKVRNFFTGELFGVAPRTQGSTRLAWISSGALLFRGLGAFFKTLYFTARPITLIAYGLHLGGEVAREGFLTVASPGITLEWNPNATTGVFTEKSYIILKSRATSVPGLYLAGKGGYFVGKDVRGFMTSLGMEPTEAAKYSDLGDTLMFGGIMYNQYPGLISLQEQEKSKGLTKIDTYKGAYLLGIRQWENHGFTVIQDPATFKELSGEVSSAVGMRTTNVDLYRHSFENEQKVKDLFPLSWTLSEKLTDWGFQSNLWIAGTAFHMVPQLGAARGLLGLTTVSLLSRGVFGAGQNIMTSQLSYMEELQKCYEDANYTSSVMDCSQRLPCEQVERRCEGEIAWRSGWLAVSGTAQIFTEELPVVSLPLGIVDYFIITGFEPAGFEGKLEVTQNCMSELLACNERSFFVIGGSSYSDPGLAAAEQQQIGELQSLPGLESLPLDKFIEGLNITDPMEMGQMQVNIHSEMDRATGRVAFERMYYVHLKDATIDWVTSELPIHLCPIAGGSPDDANCITVQNDELKVGGETIVKNELVAFKWMDELLPALVIPATAVTVDITKGNTCTLFSVDKTGQSLALNPSVISKFTTMNFQELERMMGTLRDIETAQGAIYPNQDYNGDFRFEWDKDDGSYEYSEQDAEVTANAKVKFKGEVLDFESAVFTGGTIIKKGDFIYILPRYFRPSMTGKRWLEETHGTPLVSATGQPLEALDAAGNILGIDAAQTNIPGGENLGILTRLDAWDDANADGVLQDDERAGWRFYTEDNQSKFEMWYNGQKEVYDADQIEIDEETGTISVYEKDQPHVEANLLRSLETKVDSLGRTLLTIKDGQGNVLLEEALVTYLKGTNGAIQYDHANNNYVFVNGQPVEVNNDFKTNGFNAVTGRPEPPLLQPSAVTPPTGPTEKLDELQPPAIPTRPEGLAGIAYALAIVAGLVAVYAIGKRKE
ncbi:MAG: hypothetical protein JW834_03845 [Candidatus Diapherotrites archaeon]|nr:hypothetical protein [Candidatus Diapherotrites archaeon]